MHSFLWEEASFVGVASTYGMSQTWCRGDKSLNACILDGIDGSGQILGLTDQATKCLAEVKVVGGHPKLVIPWRTIGETPSYLVFF